MKKTILFAGILLSFFVKCFTQIAGDTIYFDENWNQTVKSKAGYFRIVSLDTPRIRFMVRDYYMDGQLQMEGAYRSINPDVKTGEFAYWYKNGIRHIECQYKGGLLNGQYREWYEDGSLKAEKNYSDFTISAYETDLNQFNSFLKEP